MANSIWHFLSFCQLFLALKLSSRCFLSHSYCLMDLIHKAIALCCSCPTIGFRSHGRGCYLTAQPHQSMRKVLTTTIV